MQGRLCVQPRHRRESAVPTFTAPAAMPAAGSIFADHLPDTVLRWMHAVWRGPCRLRRPASAAGGRGCRLCRDRPGNFQPRGGKPAGRGSAHHRWPRRCGCLPPACLPAHGAGAAGNAPACSAGGSSDLLDAARETAGLPGAGSAVQRIAGRSCTARWPGRSRKMNIRTFRKQTDYRLPRTQQVRT